MRKSLLLKCWHILLVTMMSFILCNISNADQTLDNVVAVVNTEVITASQLDKQINIAQQQIAASGTPMPSADKLRQQVLDQLINMTLQLQIAKKASVTVDDQQLDQAISQIAAKNNMTAAQLQEKVVQQGMNFNSYKDEIRKEMIISQLQQREIQPTVTVTDQEVSDMLDLMKQKPQLAQPANNAASANTQYHVIDILVPLTDGADSATIKQAKIHAQSLLSKLQNSNTSALIILGNDATVQVNDLGWRTLAQLPDIFDETVASLSAGQYSSPIQAGNGIHIIQLVAINGVANNAMSFQSGLSNSIPQSEVQMIMIKKNPLLSDEEMQAHLQLLRSQAVESADFASVATLNSQDPNSASKGGELGWISPGTLPPQVDQALSQLKTNEISQPIQTPVGYYIVKLLGKRQMDNSQMALQDRARQLVYQRKYGEALQNWLQKIRSQSYVKISS